MALTPEFLFRHASDAILVIDKEWRVVAANPRAETLLSAGAARLVGEALAQAIPDLAGSRAEELLREVSMLERRVEHFSARRYTWYEIRMLPLKDQRVLFVRDVSDRIRQMKTDAVRESVRQIIMDAPVAISITRGPEHRYEIVNTMARRLIGDREVEGRTARAAFPEVDAGLFDILDDVYRSGRPVSMRDLEVAFDRNGSGELVKGTFDVTYQPLFEADGSVSGILSTSVETTAYARAREQLSRPLGAQPPGVG